MGRVSDFAVFHGQRNMEWTWMKNSPAPLLWKSLFAHEVYNMAGFLGYVRQGQAGPWLRGKMAALGGLPRMLAKRRVVQRTRAVSPSRLWALMDANWIQIKRAEKRFDFD